MRKCAETKVSEPTLAQFDGNPTRLLALVVNFPITSVVLMVNIWGGGAHEIPARRTTTTEFIILSAYLLSRMRTASSSLRECWFSWQGQRCCACWRLSCFRTNKDTRRKMLAGSTVEAISVFLGDDAFPPGDYLMRCFPRAQLQEGENDEFNCS
jgi:hypothetical protein